MADQNLDLTVLRNGRREDRFQVRGDPQDLKWLAGRLTGWLQGHRWNEKTWLQFEIHANEPGQGGREPITKARAV